MWKFAGWFFLVTIGLPFLAMTLASSIAMTIPGCTIDGDSGAVGCGQFGEVLEMLGVGGAWLFIGALGLNMWVVFPIAVITSLVRGSKGEIYTADVQSQRLLGRLFQIFERAGVRALIALFYIVPTIYLAPMALYQAYSGIVAVLYGGAPNIGAVYLRCVIGFGGLFGLAAAWCRVLLPNAKFHASTRLFLLTVTGLITGIATAFYFLTGALRTVPKQMFWFWLALLVLGLALLAATIGTRILRPNHTVDPDAKLPPN